MLSESPDDRARIQHGDIPDEIWEEIFCHLPHAVLKEVGCTHWRFHCLSRPFIFREFDFQEPLYGTNLDHGLRRLQFWASPEIAPLIYTCRVIHWRKPVKPYPLLATFFMSLPSFLNLQYLYLSSSDYDQTFLENVRRLPRLHLLEIIYGTTISGEVIHTNGLPPLAVSQFSLTSITPRTWTASRDWIPSLRRDTLLDMDFRCGDDFPAEILAGGCFPRVKRLKIFLDPNQPSVNVQILSKFPAVEALNVVGGYPDHHITHTPRGPHGVILDVVPLEEYDGREELLPWFLAIPTFRCLRLPWRRVADRVLALQAFKTLSNITDLSFVVSDLTYEIFRDICAVFPNLTALRVTVALHLWDDDSYDGPYAWEASTVFTALTTHSPLPCNLRKVMFRWEIQSGPERTEFSPPDLHQMKEFLLSEHVALKAIWLDGPGLFYCWSVRSGELGMQYDDDDARGKEGYWDEVGRLRPGIGLLWDQI
ncbi:hypothetical protein C8R43DRAFT_969147 [Mycena crocata]|nr:hypothetical protein C8R43DRAFT_969147 [Mycena crocata]